MGIMSWDSGFNTAPLVRTPRLTIRCEYPDTDMPPTEVTFGLSPAYDIRNAQEGVVPRDDGSVRGVRRGDG